MSLIHMDRQTDGQTDGRGRTTHAIRHAACGCAAARVHAARDPVAHGDWGAAHGPAALHTARCTRACHPHAQSSNSSELRLRRWRSIRRRSRCDDEGRDGDAGRDRVGRDAGGRAEKTCKRQARAAVSGRRRTKGRAGSCSRARAALSSGTARACLLHSAARRARAGLLAAYFALAMSARAQLADVDEVVMPASEHVRSQSPTRVHETQAKAARSGLAGAGARSTSTTSGRLGSAGSRRRCMTCTGRARPAGTRQAR